MEMKELDYFIAIAEEKSISKAAERIVRFRSVNGPKVTGVKSLDSIVRYFMSIDNLFQINR
jgi:F0F1-type ATP synthase alpha subunit